MTSPTYPPVYVVSYYLPKLAERVRKALPGVDVIEIKVESPSRVSVYPKPSFKLSQSGMDLVRKAGIIVSELVILQSSIVDICLHQAPNLRWLHNVGSEEGVSPENLNVLSDNAEIMFVDHSVRGRYIYNVPKLLWLNYAHAGNPESGKVHRLTDEAEILLADSNVIGKNLYRFQKLQWVALKGAGVDLIMKAIDPSKPLPSFRLTRTATSGRYISEYVIAYILATEKRISTISAGQQTKKWNQLECATSRSLDTLTIGILGVGNIGKVLARFCKALGMTVWGLKRTPADESFDCPDVDVCRTTEELADVLRNSDYICNTLPSTPETVDLLSGNVLSHCQSKKSIFINVGRGDVIDEESIVKAIKNEWIGGAILDVFQKEPLPEDSPLWTLPNVTVTPHISGWSANSKFQDSILKAFVENYWAYVEGTSLQNEVDFKRGY